MCPAARYACFTAGHTGPALRDNSTAALTDVVPQGHLFRCAPLRDAVPYGRFSTAYWVYVEKG